MAKKKFTGIQHIDTFRVGKRTFAFGIYSDHRLGRIPFAGLSEKDPQDTDKPVRGTNLAIGDSIENLGKEIKKREWKKIKPKKTRREVVKLTPEEIEAKKAEGEAIRKARAKKRAASNKRVKK